MESSSGVTRIFCACALVGIVPVASRTQQRPSVLWQLHAFQCGLVYCLHVVLLARRGYWDFQEAGYKCGLLNFCGEVCAAGPEEVGHDFCGMLI